MAHDDSSSNPRAVVRTGLVPPDDRRGEGYGLSDRGLAKLCERHEIPVPPRGYWAKKAHGHRVKQPPLPPPSQPRLDRIEIAPGSPAPAPDEPAESVPEIIFEQQPENRIEVAAEVSRFHPLVRRTRAALRQAKPGDRGLLFPAGPCLDVCVSKAQVARALRLMDALVRALDRRGYSPALLEKGRGLFATVFGESLSVTLIERTVQQRRKAREYRTVGARPWTSAQSTVPLGALRRPEPAHRRQVVATTN